MGASGARALWWLLAVGWTLAKRVVYASAMAEIKKLFHDLQSARVRLVNALTTRRGGTVEVQQAEGEDTIALAGYGIVFDKVGLDGARFDKGTVLTLPGQQTSQTFAVANPPVYWDHGFDEVLQLNSFGYVQDEKVDARGVWIKAQLSRNAEYMDWITELLENEEFTLGWSGGSTAHLNKYINDTRMVWPVIEFSMTPTPANPGTLGVDVVQSFQSDAAELLRRYWVRQIGLSDPADADDSAAEQAAEESASDDDSEFKNDERHVQDDGPTPEQIAEAEKIAEEQIAARDASLALELALEAELLAVHQRKGA